MKNLTMVMVGAALLGGCKMKEFSSTPLYSGSEVKFTGAVEDRVNLWPIAYWREPVGSIAWPLVSWGDDHLAFRPVYSQYKQRGSGVYDEYNLFWPIGQFDTNGDDYRLFPFFWGRDRGNDPYFCLFPAVWWINEFKGVLPFFWNDNEFCTFPLFWTRLKGESRINTLFPLYYYNHNYNHNQDSIKFWAFCGLAGYNTEKGSFLNHRFLPLYLWNRGDFFSLPYSRFEQSGKTKTRVMLGLTGWDSDIDGECIASWALPLYYQDTKKDVFVTPLGGKSGNANWIVPLYWQDKNTFASLPYCQMRGRDGEIDGAFSIPLLSGYNRDRATGDRLLYLFVGLGGHVWNDQTGGASWVFPLFYKDRESLYTLLYGRNPRSSWLFPLFYSSEDLLVTPLYGKTGDTDWLFPLYARSASGFHTIPFSYWNDEKKGTRGFVSVPLLSGASWSSSSRDYTWLALAGLVGGTSNFDGSRRSLWAAPLFYHSDKAFLSIPFGYENLGARTNMYFAAGLAGIHSGTKEGGWLFPLYSKKKDADFDEKLAIMDVAKLPEDIKTWTEVATNKVWNAKERRHEERVGPTKKATSFYTHDKRTHLLVSDNDKSISGSFLGGKKNAYRVSQRHKLGNILAFRYEGERKVDFDISTREKIEDKETGWAALLGILYNHEHRADKLKDESYARHRVLWKLWDWERENGDVSLDVFPGFTYDSKTNGYAKTSFLWRFFRYENDPEEGKKVDLFFIPLWR